MSHADVQSKTNELINELEKAIVGKRNVLELVVTAVLADGHILLEDVPGVAKTALARAVAEAAGMRFSRIQFTPDLIPADITGSTILTGANSAAEFKPGPVFANLVLGDEINRAPPKTQSALLEAMEERQVTADAVTRQLPEPFIVIGTQNPIEQEGTYPLPEAQLDRFLIRTNIGYPGRDFEVELIMRRAIVEATRTTTRTEAGASPRGSLALLKTSRARAAMAGRSHVLPDDVKAVAVPCLAHRILLQPDQWVRGVRADQVVNEILSQVPAPQAIEQSDVAHLQHQASPNQVVQPQSGQTHSSQVPQGTAAPPQVAVHQTPPPPAVNALPMQQPSQPGSWPTATKPTQPPQSAGGTQQHQGL